MGVGRCQLESQVFQRPPKKIQTVHPLTSSWVTVSLPDSCDLLSDAVTQPGLEHLARPGLRCCISLLKIKKKMKERKRKKYTTLLPLGGAFCPPFFSFLHGIPLNGPPFSLLPSSFPSHLGPPLFFGGPPHSPPPSESSSSFALWATAPSITAVSGPQPGPSPPPRLWECLGLLSRPPFATRRAGAICQRSRPGGEQPRPPGLGLPVTDSVSMANNLTRLLSGAGRPRVR